MNKSRDIEINEENPFANDLLERAKEITNLTPIVLNFNDPLVFALDSPWGTGKTTFVRLWQAYLKQQNKQFIFFNAWETDFAQDPLIVLVAELNKWLKSQNESVASNFLEKSKKILPSITKQAAIGLTKALTLIGVDSQEVERVISEAMGNITGDLIDNFNKQSEVIQQFKEIIEEALKSLPDDQKNLIIFIDELDRCRPTYAIELLERIKHLFSIERLVFVLSTNKGQLAHSIRAVYGNEFDAKKYLQRFIDLDYSLRTPNIENYIKLQVKSLKITDYFSKRRDGSYQQKHLIDCCLFFSKRFSLKLRDINLLLQRIRLIICSIPHDHYLYEVLLITLLIIREYNKELYNEYIESPLAAKKLIAFIAQDLELMDIQQQEMFCWIAAYLLASFKADIRCDNQQFENFFTDYKKLEITDEIANNRIIELITHLERSGNRWGISRIPTIERIELLHQINIEL